MICRIADLIVDIPASGSLAPRCTEYLCDDMTSTDVIIRTELYNGEKYPKNMTEEMVEYMESGWQFYFQLLRQNGIYLHSSAIAYQGKAFLFSGNPGAGKSTHTRLWQSVFGEEACVFNDDKPALRFLDGTWYAYGTPWCGKDGINRNMKVPVAGICFMKQAQENKIRRLSPLEAAQRIIAQTMSKFKMEESLDLMLGYVNNLVKTIPVFELENRPEPEAAMMSYETMRRAAEEMGL